jgi:excisionase family DNA binding protein
VKDKLLTVTQAAESLNTSERFVRRLIAERRIAFVRIGRHVRIASNVLDDFVASGVVPARQTKVSAWQRRAV